MQLVVQHGVPFFGGVYDLVLAGYPDGVPVAMDQFPSDAMLVPYAGDVAALERVGPVPNPGEPDVRLPRAPAIDLLVYASQRQNEALAKVWSFDVSDKGKPAHVVTTRLDAGGAIAMMKIALWSQMNAGTPDAVLPYSNDDFSDTSLTVVEAVSLARQAGAIDAQGYAILNDIKKGLSGKKPTIRTTADVDAAFAALKA